MKEKELKSLYVATHDYTSLTKVGVSVNSISRLQGFTNTVGSELALYYESPLLENWREIEADVLNNFKEFRTGGEWINKSPKEIIDYIKSIKNRFNNKEYTDLKDRCITIELEKVNEVVNLFDIISFRNVRQRELKEVIKGVYVDEDFLFYVSYYVGKEIKTLSFNVYKSALDFSKKIGLKRVLLNLETREYINNPKFKINE